jgi:hypothetical protein
MQPWNFLQVSRRGIAVDPRTGDSFRINESASMILNGLQQGKNPQEIAKLICEEFAVNYGSVLSDVYEFMANLSIQRDA